MFWLLNCLGGGEVGLVEGGGKAELASSSNVACTECLWSPVCCLCDITQELFFSGADSTTAYFRRQ